MKTPTGKVLGIDPGTTTGVAVIKYHLATFSTKERPMFKRVPQVSFTAASTHPFDLVKDELRKVHPDTLIVVESTPTHGRNKGRADVDTVVALVNENNRGNAIWVTPGYWKGIPSVEKVVKEYKESAPHLTQHELDALGIAVAIGHRTFVLNHPVGSR